MKVATETQIKASDLRIGNYVKYNPKAVDKGTKIIPLQIIRIDRYKQNTVW